LGKRFGGDLPGPGRVREAFCFSRRRLARPGARERSILLLSKAICPARGAREKHFASLGGDLPGPGRVREAFCFSRRRFARPGVRERSILLLSEAICPARGAREKHFASLEGDLPGPGCAREAFCFSRRRFARSGAREKSILLLSRFFLPSNDKKIRISPHE